MRANLHSGVGSVCLAPYQACALVTLSASGARLQGSSQNDEIQTPRYLFDRLNRAFEFNYDGFASGFNHLLPMYSSKEGTYLFDERSGMPEEQLSELDGFTFSWADLHVFANPPYSLLMESVAKFEAEVERAAWIAMLVKVDTSTKWYQRLEECAIVQPLKRRVKFTHPNPPAGWSGASFASAIAFPRRDWVAL
jgi:phage N-6-adenine-methyltransferase